MEISTIKGTKLKKEIQSFLIMNGIFNKPVKTWYIGLIENPEKWKAKNNNLKIWNYWETESIEIAKEIKCHFLDEYENLENCIDRGNICSFVYIYRKQE